MWWADVTQLRNRILADPRCGAGVAPTAKIEDGAIIDEALGPITIGAGSVVCSGAIIRGPTIIGSDCLVGNNAMIRGPALLGDSVRVGFAAEIKNAEIRRGSLIGPMCFIADSRVDEEVYLGAQVRTSNQRLDRATISVLDAAGMTDTKLVKLGCWIGRGAALGIQVIVLPGRVIAPGSLFEPRITITRNFPRGQYRAHQTIEAI